jgi:hypothetical protein
MSKFSTFDEVSDRPPREKAHRRSGGMGTSPQKAPPQSKCTPAVPPRFSTHLYNAPLPHTSPFLETKKNRSDFRDSHRSDIRTCLNPNVHGVFDLR